MIIDELIWNRKFEVSDRLDNHGEVEINITGYNENDAVIYLDIDQVKQLAEHLNKLLEDEDTN